MHKWLYAFPHAFLFTHVTGTGWRRPVSSRGAADQCFVAYFTLYLPTVHERARALWEHSSDVVHTFLVAAEAVKDFNSLWR